ncbi:MocR-like pyridoxine biosynthesis transcription factor PdxR [Chitinibacteraceae bacterium HSL-7]
MDYSLLLARDASASPVPGQRRLYLALRSAILQRTLAAGTRLPGSRHLAGELGLARNSVVWAFEQLAAEGLIACSRQGSVVVGLGPQAMAEPEAMSASLSARGRAFRTPYGSLDAFAPFTPGVPALDQVPHAQWQRLLTRHWRDVRVAQLGYGDPAGEPALRDAIADHIRAARGVVCDASQVIVTDGTQHSLDLVAWLFADAGDTAWVENPGYNGAVNALTTAQLAVHPVDVDDEGLAPTGQDWQQHPPRLIYVTPTHQYPLGCVLSLARRLELIRRAQASGALIIEDDYDSEFRHDGTALPAIQGLLPDAPVVYLGTFSKTLFPALRTGFIVVPRAYVAPVHAALAQCQPRGRQVEQRVLAEFIASGAFFAHLRRMRKLYRARRDALADALAQQFGGDGIVSGGAAGMHLALRLNTAAPDKALSEAALAKGLVARPLSAYLGAPRSDCNGFVLGYAQVPENRMAEQVARLAALVRQG